MTTTDSVTSPQPGIVPDVGGRDLLDARQDTAVVQHPSGVYSAHERLSSLATSLSMAVSQIEDRLGPVLVPTTKLIETSAPGEPVDVVPKASPVAENLATTADAVGRSIARLSDLLVRIDV
ncbi:MAG: hypothetical protein KGH75_00380 [Rhodospirillales bacterium]|nr:hypothetical protein [Rhodospirillales bacterium]